MTETDSGSDWTPPVRTLRRPHIYGIMALLALGSGAAPMLLRPLQGAYYNLVYGPGAALFYEPNMDGADSYAADSALTPAYDQPAVPAYTDPATYPAETDSPLPVVASRAWEATDAGLVPIIEWHELAVAPASSHELLVDAVAGAVYRVLARGAPGCDVDIVISEELKDDAVSEDATLDFTVQSSGLVPVAFPVFAAEAASCTIGIGVYRN